MPSATATWPRRSTPCIAEIARTPEALDALLERQNYRLAYWRAAERELDYRRFFDINTLVGLRVEDARVFADTHALILRWLDDGVLDGLRVDHPDGLRDPTATCSACASARRARWICGREDPGPGEQLAGPLARRRHHRLRLPELARRALRRSGGRGSR